MRRWLTSLLLCPRCGANGPLDLTAEAEERGDVLSGRLECGRCAATFPIKNGIPRFVAADRNYAENFGAQWRMFRTTQIDRLAGHGLSQSRFFGDTRWNPDWLRGKLILDAGCGAGRFSDVMAQHGARVIACDLSTAVEACRETDRDAHARAPSRGEIEIVQADLLALPFKAKVFDAVHCAGVIQHVADPEGAMQALVNFARPGGRIFYNFYEIDPSTKFQIVKYLLRRTTPNWRPERLFAFCHWLCRIFFLPSLIMSRIPKVRFFNRFLPICSVHPADMPVRQQFELTLLDTIDWYGPKYEIRQDHQRVAELLVRAGARDVRSAPGLAWAVKDGPESLR